MFILLLIVGAFVVVAAHQFRYDYFGSGRGRSLSLKDFFGEKPSKRSPEPVEKHAAPEVENAQPKSAAPAAKSVAREEGNRPAVGSTASSGDEPGRKDRKELNSLIDQVAP